jgi:hypothetical protein
MMQMPLSLNHLLDRAGTLFASNEIVSRLPDKSLRTHTYGEYYRRTRALASALQQLGIQKGERVATLCWNHHAHLECYFGIPAAGAVMHTLNLRLSPAELGFIAQDADDRVLIIDDVISAGTSVGESMQLIAAAGAQAVGVMISLDRQERGKGSLSAAQEVEREPLCGARPNTWEARERLNESFDGGWEGRRAHQSFHTSRSAASASRSAKAISSVSPYAACASAAIRSRRPSARPRKKRLSGAYVRVSTPFARDGRASARSGFVAGSAAASIAAHSALTGAALFDGAGALDTAGTAGAAGAAVAGRGFAGDVAAAAGAEVAATTGAGACAATPVLPPKSISSRPRRRSASPRPDSTWRSACASRRSSTRVRPASARVASPRSPSSSPAGSFPPSCGTLPPPESAP